MDREGQVTAGLMMELRTGVKLGVAVFLWEKEGKKESQKTSGGQQENASGLR